MLKNIYFPLNVSYLQMSLKYFHSNQLHSDHFLFHTTYPKKQFLSRFLIFVSLILLTVRPRTIPSSVILPSLSLHLLPYLIGHVSLGQTFWICNCSIPERLHIESMQHISHQSDIVSTVGMRLNLENRILGSNSVSSL